MRQQVSDIPLSSGNQRKRGRGIEAQRDAIAGFASAEGREFQR